MNDDTEVVRREIIERDRAEGPLTREQLAAKYNSNVYDTAELQEAFTVHNFLAPFVFVTRKQDNMKGSLKFQHMPRFYYGFEKSDK
jgi:hypothetical protein